MAKANGVPADKISSLIGRPTATAMVDETLATVKYDVKALSFSLFNNIFI